MGIEGIVVGKGQKKCGKKVWEEREGERGRVSMRRRRRCERDSEAGERSNKKERKKKRDKPATPTPSIN